MRVTIAEPDPVRCVGSPSRHRTASGCARRPVARRPGAVVTLRSRPPSPNVFPVSPPSMNAHPVKSASWASSAARIVEFSVVGSGRAAPALIATSPWRSPIYSLLMRGGEFAPTPARADHGLSRDVLVAPPFASDSLLAVQQLHGAVNFCVRALVNFSVREHTNGTWDGTYVDED